MIDVDGIDMSSPIALAGEEQVAGRNAIGDSGLHNHGGRQSPDDCVLNQHFFGMEVRDRVGSLRQNRSTIEQAFLKLLVRRRFVDKHSHRSGSTVCHRGEKTLVGAA